MVSPNLTVSPLPRYTRPREESVAAPLEGIIPFAQSDAAIDQSTLSAGSRALLRGLLRVGSTRMFAGGGAGIEYGGLLKTAARPDYIAAHVSEAANHLRERQADLLLVPGMSGYPVGAMYALAASTPALLLKKSQLGDANPNAYPAGAFVIPSYTGEGDVVMHADPAAVEDIVATIVARKLAEQIDQPVIELDLPGGRRRRYHRQGDDESGRQRERGRHWRGGDRPLPGPAPSDRPAIGDRRISGSRSLPGSRH